MEIEIQREALLKPLSLITNVVERRHTMPILTNVLIQAENNTITLTATDLEVELRTQISGVAGDTGEFTVPARKLFDICRALPAASNIKLRTDKNKIVVRSGTSRYSLTTAAAGDFPLLEGGDWSTRMTFRQAALKQLFESTAFCMAQQDVRYYLNGLLLEFTEKGLRAVATDGHRLALGQIDGKNALERQVIVPRKGILEVVRFLEAIENECELALSANHIRVSAGNVVFISKLIDGRFPDYTKVVPKAHAKILRIGREHLRNTLARAAILSNEKYRGVRLALEKGTLRITAHNPEHEEAEEEIGVEYSGDPVEIGFNVGYLIDAIGALAGDEVEIGLGDADSSATLRAVGDPNYLYVVMPMRL